MTSGAPRRRGAALRLLPVTRREAGGLPRQPGGHSGGSGRSVVPDTRALDLVEGKPHRGIFGPGPAAAAGPRDTRPSMGSGSDDAEAVPFSVTTARPFCPAGAFTLAPPGRDGW